MLRALVLIAGLAMTSIAWAQRPPAIVPDDPHAVLERLPHGYARLMPTPVSSTPARAPVSIVRIHQLLATAAQTGDARLAARADALLAHMPAQASDPDVLLARAFSAQHRHDFATAVILLDTAIAQSPRSAAAHLSRAQVQLVRGRLDLARADCTALVLGIDAGSGLLCVGMVSLRGGHYAAAEAALDRWLQDSPSADEGRANEGRRYALVMRAEVAARAGDRDADAWFRRSLALAPDDVRTLAAYARYLRGVGRDREVATLLAAQVGHDGLQLQRTLAAHRVDPRTAAPLVAAQAQRFAAAHAAGSPPELRDEAEFLLVTRNDARDALALAAANFRAQRDYEDVALLQRTAMAARRMDALQPLQAWADAQHLSLPPTSEVAR
jgi:Tfp pilus assembly protein PilF